MTNKPTHVISIKYYLYRTPYYACYHTSVAGLRNISLFQVTTHCQTHAMMTAPALQILRDGSALDRTVFMDIYLEMLVLGCLSTWMTERFYLLTHKKVRDDKQNT